MARAIHLAVALGLLPCTSVLAEAPPSGSDNAAARFEFDSQGDALAVALERLMSTTGVSIIVTSAEVAERRAAPVKGRYDAEAALRMMLVGTGLNVRSIGPDVFTLMPPPPAKRPLPQSSGYAAAIQEAVTRALCQHSDTRFMQYRTVLRLWLDPAGDVRRAELASSTGDSGLDTAVVAALQRTSVGEPPPVGLSQPVKLAIMPGPSGASACTEMSGRAKMSSDQSLAR